MAQAVQAVPASPNQDLPLSNYADIAGLSITILNGSGWIRATFSASINNQYAGTNVAQIQLLVDGIQQAHFYFYCKLLQGEGQIISRTALLKPGSGQHVYKLQGYSSQESAYIVSLAATFIIEEPGF